MRLTIRRSITLSAALFTLLLAFAAGAAPWVTTARVSLHARPNVRSATLATVPAGAAVDVAKCSGSWCSVAWNGTSGWAARRLLAPAGRAASSRSGKGYRNADGQWVPSPRASPGGPPPGASAQCNDGTYSFSTHRRGTCSHHGGVRRWL